MATNTFTFRVVFSLYASARLNIIPKPGIITLDDTGTLTLTDTSNQEVIVQKPFAEIDGIRPSQLVHFYKNAVGAYGLILYVGHNEAYKIVFGSENPALNSSIDIYEKILTGDMAAATQEFNANNISHADKNEVAVAMHQANDDYANFIANAKQAGVYKSAFTAAPFIGGLLMIVAVILFFMFVLLHF